MKRRLATVEDEKRETEAELDYIRNDFQTERTKLDIQKRRNETLRRTVQRMMNATSDEPSRAIIIASFLGIKDLIQTIVNEDYTMQRPRLERYQDNIPLYNKQKQFFRSFHDGMSENERKNRTRAKLFDILWEEIFSKKIFGLSEDMEQWLVHFENAFFEAAKGQSGTYFWEPNSPIKSTAYLLKAQEKNSSPE